MVVNDSCRPASLGWAAWGLGATLLLIGEALFRLTPISLEASRHADFTSFHGLVMAGWVVGNAYLEGWRGFHRKFAPRCIQAALEVAERGSLSRRLLCPLVCLGLYGVNRARLIGSWALVVGIVSLVVLVGSLPQPWRGIIDAGVVAGLAVGVGSLIFHAAVAVAFPSINESACQK